MSAKYLSNICRRCCKNEIEENSGLSKFCNNPELVLKYEYVFNKKVTFLYLSKIISLNFHENFHSTTLMMHYHKLFVGLATII